MGPLKLRTPSRALVLSALVAGAFVLPAVGLAGIAASAGHSRISISDDGRGENMSLDIGLAGGGSLEAKSRGRFTLTPAEDDVATIERGASFAIEQVRDGTKRRIEFTSGPGGVEREYAVDGRKQPLDGDGRRWLAEVIPQVLRTSGLFATERVQRMLSRGGPGAVLDEVALIPSDYGRRVYLAAMFERAQLDAPLLDRTFQLVDRIGSDFERRTTLEAMIGTQLLGDAHQVRLLRSVAKIGSDFEKRSVLEALAPKLATAAGVRRAWGETLATIGSDFERRSSLQALVQGRELDRETIETALAAVTGIGSDFEKRESLASLAPHVAKHVALAKAYADTAAGIGSDFERREALLALVATGTLDAPGYAAVLEATASIGSDFERREVLVGVAAKMPADAGLISRYRRIARSLDDYERGQAEKALDRFDA